MSEPIFSVLTGKYANGFTVSGFTGNLDGYLSDSVLNGTYAYDAGQNWYVLVDGNGDRIYGDGGSATFYCNDPNCVDWQFWSGGGILINNNGTNSTGIQDFPTSGWALSNGSVLTFSPI